ncbi:MAG TPA: alpha-1,2-fucosyltransferase [Bellilinea sp.]|nr:alpha-1,2-fucosyltransferase [Bellilinea sp.]
MQRNHKPEMLLHYPVLSRADFILFRLLGPGLGNLLFPLYRAFQSQKRMGGSLVFPQFFQIKLGPFLRQEKDKRTYFDLFCRRDVVDVLAHIRAIFGDSMPEECVNQESSQFRVRTIRYEGLKGYFRDLDPEWRFDFCDYLLQRASFGQQLRNEIDEIGAHDICVHLRRGDFMPESAQEGSSSGMCYRIADDWYVQAVSKALQKFPDAKVRVFTDADKLEPSLLEKLNCSAIDQSRNALHALMKMSAHGAIVASKSSFSLWSAFLGQQYMYINNDFDLGFYVPDGGVEYERV